MPPQLELSIIVSSWLFQLFLSSPELDSSNGLYVRQLLISIAIVVFSIIVQT